MTRNLVVFAIAFAIGAFLTVGVRAGLHRPYGVAAPAPAPAASAPAPSTVPDPHQGHGAAPAPAAPATGAAVINARCPVCGMKPDPTLPVVLWKGKRIGLGCGACPEKFAADPDRYGEAAVAGRIAD